jgi:hypothetical protein
VFGDDGIELAIAIDIAERDLARGRADLDRRAIRRFEPAASIAQENCDVPGTRVSRIPSTRAAGHDDIHSPIAIAIADGGAPGHRAGFKCILHPKLDGVSRCSSADPRKLPRGDGSNGKQRGRFPGSLHDFPSGDSISLTPF